MDPFSWAAVAKFVATLVASYVLNAALLPKAKNSLPEAAGGGLEYAHAR